LTNTKGIVGIETKYHEDCRREKPPTSERLTRYLHVMQGSRVFIDQAINDVSGTSLQQIWLDHLLAVSMLQHPSHTWTWAKFVLVHPTKNPSYARAAEKYKTLLRDKATFGVCTIESLLDANILPADAASSFAERYLW
jgi:hypothetical protein